MAKMIRPVGNLVLIEPKPLAEKTTKSGIVVPGSAGAGPITYYEGKVLAVGTKVEMVKVGEQVAFHKYGYDEIEIDEKKFFLVEETSMIAVYDEK